MLIWELLAGSVYPLPNSSTPRLDKELLLARVLQRSREWLCMNGDAVFSDITSADQRRQWERYYQRRLAGEPIAYLLGYQDFWKQRLLVTPDVLIPRPETEGLVELALREVRPAITAMQCDVRESAHNNECDGVCNDDMRNNLHDDAHCNMLHDHVLHDDMHGNMHDSVRDNMRDNVVAKVGMDDVVVADLGTGSGAISIALASERPHWQLIASDISEKALAVAQLNARQCGANNIRFVQSNWLSAFNKARQLDAIVANPPYLTEGDPHLRESIRFEPRSALVADQNGLADIFTIIAQAKKYLKPNGILAIEHGYQQADVIRRFWQEEGGYKDVVMERDLAGQPRLSWARCR